MMSHTEHTPKIINGKYLITGIKRKLFVPFVLYARNFEKTGSYMTTEGVEASIIDFARLSTSVMCALQGRK